MKESMRTNEDVYFTLLNLLGLCVYSEKLKPNSEVVKALRATEQRALVMAIDVFREMMLADREKGEKKK